MTQTAVQCKGIKKIYGTNENRIEALKGIDLELYEGQLTILAGPSGSGKTTLLSIIATILTPDEGQLFLLGKEVNRLSESKKAQFRRNHLGIIFQSLFLVPTLTVAENIALPLVVDGHSQHEARDKAVELLKQMKIDHKANMAPTTLSRGQQQKVAIARAMVNNSEVILCDEPTSSLDQTAGFEVMSFLRDLALNFSKTVLVVTHDHRIFPFANRIVSMSDGQIIAGEYA